MSYHRVVLNPAAKGLWCLDAPRDDDGEEVDPRDFCECRRWESSGRLTADAPSGQPASLSLGDFDYPVADETVATHVEKLDSQVQLVPLKVRGKQERYLILNALRRVDCVDEEASKFDRFEQTGSRPDLAGQYKTFYRLRLHPTIIPEGVHIFRVSGYEVALVVSDEMKDLLIKVGGDDGVSFVAVT
jgi:hypothetical protein